MQTILVAHSRDGLGGSVITGALLAKALDTGGEWKTLSICNSSGSLLEYHRSIGVEVVPLMESQGLRYTPNPRDGNRLQRIAKRILLFRAARRFLKSASPAAIHVHDESSALAWGLAARRKGIPLVWQVHQQLPQRWIDWLLRRLATHIVFVSANNQHRFDGVTLPPTSVIHNGVDLAQFYPAQRKPSGTVTVGFVSNLVDRKRPDWLVRAAGRLRREGLDIKVLLAGNDFTGGHKANELQALAEREGLGQLYSYVGPRSDVPDVLRSLDILVLPSQRDKEAFPRIVVEAMACGVPVVATNVGGIPEVVEDGVTGVLEPVGSVEAMGRRAVELLRDTPRYQAMRDAAVAKAREFSADRVVPMYEALYHEVLE